MTLEISRIQTNELEVFVNLIRTVNHDIEQPLWEADQLTPERLLRDYGLGSMHLGSINGEPVATFVLIESDSSFWPNVPEGESLFIHKVVVARAWKGQNLSSQVLDYAVGQVLERGKKFLRLDTDATRPALCGIYVGRRLTDAFDYALYELEVRA
jgi:GNAT superfamily N-acetyltransferase